MEKNNLKSSRKPTNSPACALCSPVKSDISSLVSLSNSLQVARRRDIDNQQNLHQFVTRTKYHFRRRSQPRSKCMGKMAPASFVCVFCFLWSKLFCSSSYTKKKNSNYQFRMGITLKSGRPEKKSNAPSGTNRKKHSHSSCGIFPGFFPWAKAENRWIWKPFFPPVGCVMLR